MSNAPPKTAINPAAINPINNLPTSPGCPPAANPVNSTPGASATPSGIVTTPTGEVHTAETILAAHQNKNDDAKRSDAEALRTAEGNRKNAEEKAPATAPTHERAAPASERSGVPLVAEMRERHSGRPSDPVRHR